MGSDLYSYFDQFQVSSAGLDQIFRLRYDSLFIIHVSSFSYYVESYGVFVYFILLFFCLFFTKNLIIIHKGFSKVISLMQANATDYMYIVYLLSLWFLFMGNIEPKMNINNFCRLIS